MAKKAEQKELKHLYFTVEVYPDCDAHSEFLKMITSVPEVFGFKACWIMHDRDVYDLEGLEKRGMPLSLEGTPKKAHYHFFLKMPYPCTLHNVQNVFARMGIEDRWVEGVSMPLAFCLYLTHSDPKSRMLGKFKYDESDIRGDLSILVKETGKSILDLLVFLDRWQNDPFDMDYSLTALIKSLVANGLFDCYKAQGFTGTRLAQEACNRKRDLVGIAKARIDAEKAIEDRRRDLEESFFKFLYRKVPLPMEGGEG